MKEKFDLREIQAIEYKKLVDDGFDILYLVSDSFSTSKLSFFRDSYPNKVLNFGIAEQNLIGVAAGLSVTGFIPVTGNAASFLVSKSLEQLKIDVSYSNSNVKVNGMHTGFGYAKDGVTHHEVNDISIFRCLPNFEIFVPCDARETCQIVRYSVLHKGPVYISYATGKFANVTPLDYHFVPGKPIWFQKGNRVTIVCLGTSIHDVLEAEVPDADVFCVSSIRPIDLSAILKSVERTKKVVTVEQHSTHGGIGSIIAEAISENGVKGRLVRLGIPEGDFTANQSIDYNKRLFKLDSDGIAKVVSALIK